MLQMVVPPALPIREHPGIPEELQYAPKENPIDWVMVLILIANALVLTALIVVILVVNKKAN